MRVLNVFTRSTEQCSSRDCARCRRCLRTDERTRLTLPERATSMGGGTDRTEVVPELEQQPGDLLVTKHRVGALIGTSLDSVLHEKGGPKS